MPSFTITTADTSARTLAVQELGVVTSTGALSTGGTAVTISDFALLTVHGAISSFLFGVSSVRGGQIVIGSGGSISANQTAIFQSADADSNVFNLRNDGTVIGSNGVIVAGLSASIVNTGSIQGYLGDGVRLEVLGASTFDALLDNSGTIRGRATGVVSTGTAMERITNGDGGVIAGSTAAMSLSDAVSLVVNRGLMDGDVLLGGGADRFDGAFGQQRAVFGGADNDTIRGGEADDSLLGDAGNDVLRGGAGDDALTGGTENDSLSGGAGEDVLSGGDGNDSAYGGAGDDDLTTTFGADLLLGGEGDDILRGGGDKDTLTGGAGDDTLTGGSAADTFVFARNQGTDRITDFADNIDRIDLRAFDFDSLAQVRALTSASSLGLRLDLPGEGVLFVQGLTLARLNATDLLL